MIGLSTAFIFFGVGHFLQTEPMTEMLPPSWVHYRTAIVYLLIRGPLQVPLFGWAYWFAVREKSVSFRSSLIRYLPDVGD